MFFQISSSASKRFLCPFLFFYLIFHSCHFVASVHLPIAYPHNRMSESTCLGLPFADDFTDQTVLQALKSIGVRDSKKFDKRGGNYNIYSRMLYNANLEDRLNDPDEQLTIFIAKDASVRSSVDDIMEKFDFPGKIKTEADAYSVLSQRLPQLYSWPQAVKTAIIRNHILSAKILPCEFTNTKYWITWANQNVTRVGNKIHSDGSTFPDPEVDISFLAIEAKNGVIYQADRLVMPDLSGFSEAPSPTPSPSKVPSPSASRSVDAQPTVQPSISATPSVVPPSPSVTALPSITSIPKLSEPLVNYSPDNTAQPGSSPSDENDSRGNSASSPEASNESACFPSDMHVRLSATETRQLKDLIVGDRVYTSSFEKDSVIAFSHRIHSLQAFPFVRIDTTSLHNITLSHGHFIYVNGKLKAARDTRVGDIVITEAGKASVTSVKDVWSKGLYAPHTLGGDLMVNGVLVSCYTSVIPETTAHTLLAPIRALFRTRFVSNPLGSLLYHGVDQSISARLSQLTWAMSQTHR